MEIQTLPSITKAQYGVLQDLFNAFNAEFFGGELPEVCFTLDYSRAKSTAYYSARRLKYAGGDRPLDVIAFNPDLFYRTPEQIESTMLHEMCHEWESVEGKAPRTAYHSKAWADKMRSFGLSPVFMNTARTSVTHTVDEGGRFDLFVKSSPPLQVALLKGREPEKAGSKRKTLTEKSRNKVKYTCPVCSAHVWGKPNLFIKCCICGVDYEAD